MDEKMEGKCRYCYWNKNLPRCPDGKIIANTGNCPDWRMYKLSDADRKRQHAKHVDAHERDKERRKMTRKQRRKEARGGA